MTGPRKKFYLIISFKLSQGISILDQIADKDRSYTLRSKCMLSYEDRIYTVIDIRSKDYYRGKSFVNIIVDFDSFKMNGYSDESVQLNIINKFMVNKKSIITAKEYIASLE